MTDMDTARLATLAAGCLAGPILGSLAGGLVLAVACLRGRVRSSRGWPAVLGAVTASTSRRHSARGSDQDFPVMAIPVCMVLAGLDAMDSG
jgi:hypothetical protein